MQHSESQSKALSGYIYRRELAGQLGVSLRTLDLWHEKKIGPKRTAIGKQIWYRVDGVREWLQSREQ